MNSGQTLQDLHRIQFAFTITFQLLFPQLTMGLAPLIVVFKGLYLGTGNAKLTMPRASGPASLA